MSACGPSRSHYLAVDRNIAETKYLEADSVVEKHASSYGGKSAVLYDLDRAITLHLAGRYEESNSHLHRAEDRIDDLFTKSLTGQVGAMLTNDNTLPYEGEDFEKVMLNIFSALNYIFMGRIDSALVEIRKVTHKLTLYNDRYEKKSVYKDDAFARYLSGILFEARGELNDALVSYRKAHEAYQQYAKDFKTPRPPGLSGDILRLAEALGATDIVEQYQKEFPDTTWTPYRTLEKKSELILISQNGLAPIKEDFFVDVPLPDRVGFYPFRVAFPKFVARPNSVAYSEIHVTADGRAVASRRTVVAEDVTAIARKDLEDRIGRIQAKAFARAIAKYGAGKIVEKQARASNNTAAEVLVVLGTRVYAFVSEQADKRSWRTLPGQFQMARLELPPGEYSVVIETYSHSGGLIERKHQESITLKPGEKQFLNQRIVGASQPR